MLGTDINILLAAENKPGYKSLNLGDTLCIMFMEKLLRLLVQGTLAVPK